MHTTITQPKIKLPTIIIIICDITLLQDMLYTVLYIKNKYNRKKKFGGKFFSDNFRRRCQIASAASLPT